MLLMSILHDEIVDYISDDSIINIPNTAKAYFGVYIPNLHIMFGIYHC